MNQQEFDRLEDYIDRLTAKYTEIKEENERLKRELAESRSFESRFKGKIGDLLGKLERLDTMMQVQYSPMKGSESSSTPPEPQEKSLESKNTADTPIGRTVSSGNAASDIRATSLAEPVAADETQPARPRVTEPDIPFDSYLSDIRNV